MNEQEKNPESTTTPATEPVVETTPEVTTETAASEAAAEETAAPEEASKPTEEVKEVTEEKAEATEVTASDVVAETVEQTAKTAPAAAMMAYAMKAKKWIISRKYTISAVVLVVVGLVGLLYIMEEQGRIHTGVFDKVESVLTAGKPVAKVNDGKVTKKQLETSISQISAGAEAQGMDTSDPELAAQIRSQAVDMLINTELLMQEADAQGITITSEDVDARITKLVEEVGGEEVLKERMTDFGIDQKTLRSDVRNELTIQALLDKVFAEKQTDISDEEVKAFYDGAGGAEAGLPPLEEVAEQIKQQIQSTKEQEQVTELIEELRGKATIEVLI